MQLFIATGLYPSQPLQPLLASGLLLLLSALLQTTGQSATVDVLCAKFQTKGEGDG